MSMQSRNANNFLTYCFLAMLCGNVYAANLTSLKISEQGGKTSAVLIFNDAVVHKVFTLTNPQRVVIDLARTTSTVQFAKIPLANSLITHIRSGYSTPNTLRLVFDMKHTVTFQVTPITHGLRMEFSGEKGHGSLAVVNKPVGVVVNNHAIHDSHPVHSFEPHIYDPHPSKSHTSPPDISQPVLSKAHPKPITTRHNPKASRDVVIVLDPGHGGHDPGAIGPKRNAEKNVTLAIALKLKQTINKQPGMRAVMTRDGDYYVGLRERLNIARKYNADIFISIHADAFINQHSNGASVFALSPRGATSEAARWLAENENNSELGGVNLSGLDDQNGLIRTVLIDLSQTATISASLQMGSRVLQHLDNITNLHNEKVEQARFVVLKSPDIPSILIETGFISNPREEKNLTSPAYQTQLTQAIFNGIKRYFWDHPPQGSRVEILSGVNTHVVRAGETLPAIAAHYHVNVATLKALNHLPQERLSPGQKLNIPTSWT